MYQPFSLSASSNLFTIGSQSPTHDHSLEYLCRGCLFYKDINDIIKNNEVETQKESNL